MINLIVTARDPGTEAISYGSSLIRRTIRPNAYYQLSSKNETIQLTFATASKGPETFRIRSGFPGMDSDTVTLAFDLSYSSAIPKQMEAVSLP